MAKKLNLSICELQYMSTSDFLAFVDFYISIENGTNHSSNAATTPNELQEMLGD